MIHYLLPETPILVSLIGILFAFGITFLVTAKSKEYLPKDQGRAYAFNGKLSAGKPRGAGIIFVFVFAVSVLLFIPINPETIIYLALIIAEMLTGFFDDASEKPWGEYKKGILDFIIAIIVAITYLNFNSSTIHLSLIGLSITIPPVLFGILTVILVWASINVTNCTDGVDGLSSTLVIITLLSILGVNHLVGKDSFSPVIILFIVCLLAYLWFNSTPSVLLMGDAGSRAMGIFLSIAILKTGSPLLYIPLALVIILDGGLGLVKIFLGRFLKIMVLKNTKTPLHDHVRKIKGWSNTQTVFRFAIIQTMLSAVVLYAIQLH